MDFFQHQERARRNTGLLVVLFIMAVLGTVAAVNLAIVPFVASKGGSVPGSVAVVTVCVLGIVLIGSLIRVAQMSGGGRAVAEALGGRQIDPGTGDPHERRALNVVEEMAIASGMPVPPVYLLDESSINAFAAGKNPSDAVIGVTKGCITRLTRDELQGVVAHEFSHIFHQDTRLNMRLVSLLGGILAISLVGRAMLRMQRYSRRGKEAGAAIGIGLALFIVGGIGYFFGRLIQSAVSRQREYLADASAVQYTRNPDGLAGALEKIAHGPGSDITAPRATEFSHFFFASGLDSMFATHPDVNDRIARIRNVKLDPAAIGARPRVSHEAELSEQVQLTPPPPVAPPPVAPPPFVSAPAVLSAVADIGSVTSDQLDRAAALLASFPSSLVRAAHDPFAARGVVLGMLLSKDPTVRGKQMMHIRRNDPRLMQSMLLLEPALNTITPAQRLPLLELCAAAMGLLSPQQYAEFLAMISATTAADQVLDRFEWGVHALLRRAVERRGSADRNAPPPTEVDMAVATAVLCYSGARDAGEAQKAWNAARRANAQLPAVMPAQERCTLDALDTSLRSLDLGKPSVKRATLAGCVAAVCADGTTTVDEAELLRAVSDCIGVPMPPITQLA